MKVYLAGGMKTDWRANVCASTDIEAEWLSPTEHGMFVPADYVAWDLAAIRAADVVFAYIGADNINPFGLAAELGYARALGKVIILVEDEAATDQRRLNFVRELADYYSTNLTRGVTILERFALIYGGI